jgi:cation:H+ antiporter
MVAVLFVAGLVALVAGGELLVRGSVGLAKGAGISPLVIGLTVVAFGTSAPELAVSVSSALSGQGNIALGNVIGSNIFNVLFILGLSALIAPLIVAQQLVRLDVPIMIGVSAVMLLMSLDGGIGRLDGAVLFAGLVVYTVFQVRQSRRETNKQVAAEYAGEYAAKPGGTGRMPANLGLILGGLVMLVVGSRWLVDGAVSVARALGVSELVIGLTIVAAGTSLPEVATSVIAAFRGERDIAVGNVVGSNLFNILSVLGLSAVAAPDGIAVAPSAIAFDLPVMLAVAVACLPIFFTGFRVARWEGAVFLGYYGAYMVYLLLDAVEHDALPVFSAVMLAFVVPLTVVTLALVTIRALRSRGRPAAEGAA